MSIRWLPIISGNGFDNLVNFINVFGMGYILNCNGFGILFFCGYPVRFHLYMEFPN